MQASESFRLKNRCPRAFGARKPEISPRTMTREKRPSRVFLSCRVSSLTLRTTRAGFSAGAAAPAGAAGVASGDGRRQGNAAPGGGVAGAGGGGGGGWVAATGAGGGGAA